MKTVQADTRRAFSVLRRDVHSQIRALEKIKSKRQLTKEEHQILESLEQSLDRAEEIITQEIKGVIDDINK